MTDAEAPEPSAAPERSGGPRWLQGPQRAQVPSPATVRTNPTPVSAVLGAPPRHSDVFFGARYNRNGSSPLPLMVVALGALAAAWVAVVRASETPFGPDAVESSDWWINVTAVLLPGEDLGVGAYSPTRMWTAIGLLVLSGVFMALWMGRIGGNVRTGQGPFGAFLPIITFPAWWLLPLTLGYTANTTRSSSDAMLRYLVAFAMLFAQFLLLRWPTLNRIWRGGHLPYDLASIALWLPNMIPWSMFMLSNAFTYLAVGDNGLIADSSWRATPAMLDWARWTTRLSALAIIVLLIVVSIRQHQGMAQDRADDLAARAR